MLCLCLGSPAPGAAGGRRMRAWLVAEWFVPAADPHTAGDGSARLSHHQEQELLCLQQAPDKGGTPSSACLEQGGDPSPRAHQHSWEQGLARGRSPREGIEGGLGV